MQLSAAQLHHWSMMPLYWLVKGNMQIRCREYGFYDIAALLALFRISLHILLPILLFGLEWLIYIAVLLSYHDVRLYDISYNVSERHISQNWRRLWQPFPVRWRQGAAGVLINRLLFFIILEMLLPILYSYCFFLDCRLSQVKWCGGWYLSQASRLPLLF